jgi:hypothetical protein
MAGRRGSTSSAVGFVVLVILLVAGHTVAQGPGGQPPGSPLPPGSVPNPATLPSTPPLVVPPGTPGTGDPAQPVIQFVGVPGPQPAGFPVQQRFNFKILPNAQTKDLLPTPPKTQPPTGPVLADDLTKVPEVEFQAKPEKITQDGKLTEQTAHQLAKINHLNAKKTDAFMVALLESREDLAGLPFVMGDDCRTSGERARQFTIAVAAVRQALGGQVALFLPGGRGGPPGGFSGPGPGGPGFGSGPLPPGVAVAGGFWQQYNSICEQEDASRPKPDKDIAEHVTLARIAALMQMLAPESAEVRVGLVKYLTGVPHVEATKALARLAIYSPEEEVRLAAITALKVRREKDYTDILVKGLRYPWPAVAKRSADAIARLGRTDLIPELVTVLTEDDARMPAAKEIGGKKVAVVREMVKINHHRNCMMCHAPGTSSNISADVMRAEVPVPGQPLPSPSQGYGQSLSDLMIRLDVTYLRQDFSAMLPVSDAQPWPDSQRFDFFVRERKLTAEEATAYREKLTPKEEGVLSPYHKAALAALRELTGKDTAPTAEAWQKLLKISVKPRE